MRHIIVVLIALVALGGLMPVITAAPAAPVLKDVSAATPKPAQSALETTPSMAAFLNDSWTPSTFVAPAASEAVGLQRNMTRNNTTLASSNYAIYDYLNNNTSPAASSPIYTASAAGKDRTVDWTGESIYDFLNDAWTPNTPIEIFDQPLYKQHQMN